MQNTTTKFKNWTLLSVLSLASIAVTLVNCKKEEQKKSISETEDLNSSWECKGNDLPPSQQSDFESYVLQMNEDKSFSYTWNYQDSRPSVTFSGSYSVETTSHKHSNGKPISKITLAYDKVGTFDFSGTFVGIYVFDGAKKLIVNIEPTNKPGHNKWPDAAQGMGSGFDGNESVYIFRKD